MESFLIKKSIALISVYPPPYGGVSIHARLLSEELFERNAINILLTGGDATENDPIYVKRISNIKILNKIIFWHYKIPFIFRLYSNKIKIIHCHEGFSLVPYLIVHRFIFKKKIVHTLHNQWIKHRYNELNCCSRFLITIFLRDKKTFWICVNENAYRQMIDLGAIKENISIIPAYIPGRKVAHLSITDFEIVNKIKNFKKGHKLIGVYGFRIAFDSNGNDIYGFEFSVKVFKILRSEFTDIRLVILIPDATPTIEKEKILLKIRNEGLEEDILTIFDSPINNMQYFWEQIDIYFRPTTDDGDSLAIREALSYGIRVVASDVCIRPRDTLIFRSLDINNAKEKLQEALSNKFKISVTTEDYLLKLLQLYESCFK